MLWPGRGGTGKRLDALPRLIGAHGGRPADRPHAIHVAILLVVARWIRSPLFFLATGSMANIGGAASAPVVATVHPARAPLGVLMAVVGYVIGTYAGLFCAWLLSLVALHLL